MVGKIRVYGVYTTLVHNNDFALMAPKYGAANLLYAGMFKGGCLSWLFQMDAPLVPQGRRAQRVRSIHLDMRYGFLFSIYLREKFPGGLIIYPCTSWINSASEFMDAPHTRAIGPRSTLGVLASEKPLSRIMAWSLRRLAQVFSFPWFKALQMAMQG